MSRSETAFAERFDVSRETLERLSNLEALIKKWNPTINLVARSTLTDIWSRHFADSAQIFSFAPENSDHWADFGAGGGFPGLVVAILALETRPELHISLVESDLRKSAFLGTAIRDLGLSARVIAERIEDIAPLDCDVLSARALAPLPKLLGFSEGHLREDGVALFPKGARWQEEVASARENWSFGIESWPSQVDPNGKILKITGVRRV